MVLSKVNVVDIVKKQYQFKLKSFIGFSGSLIVLQLVAVIFSLSGVGQGISGRSYLEVSMDYFTADYVVVFTMIWAFIISIQIMSKENREGDYTFVTNRLTSNLSNIVFLFTVSVISGILAILSGFLLKVLIRFLLNHSNILGTGVASDLQVFLKGMVAMILYIFIVCALGYLVGALVQLSKIFIALLPVLFFGLVLVSARAGGAGQWNIFSWVFQFYFQESIFILFFIKMIITSGLIFLSAILLSRRLEVR